MGMFDFIIIDAQKLPVSKEEKELLKDRVFQTKSLENCLLSYAITKENELILQEIKENENSPELIPYFREMDEELNDPDTANLFSTKVPFHGFLRFYTSVNNTWYEFEAKFTDDKMVAIERKFKTPI